MSDETIEMLGELLDEQQDFEDKILEFSVEAIPKAEQED